MRRLRIALFMTIAVVIIQLFVLIFESRKLQLMSPAKRKPRRVLGGDTPDATGVYFVRRFFKFEGYPIDGIEPKDVTLATHCSVDYLHHIIDLVETWDGPLSVALFVPGDDAAFAEDAIDGLRLCWPKLRKTASFHLLYPRHEALRANMTNVGSFAYYSCKDITRKIHQRKRAVANTLQLEHFLRYPHNALRNIAIDGALTDYVLSIDIDLIPSQNLRDGFLTFARNNDLFMDTRLDKLTKGSQSMREVYVIPAFEVQDSDTKLYFKDIIQLIEESQQARILLQETCRPCHHPTNYEKWYSTSKEDNNITVSHKVAFENGWEPYIILRRDAPRYDTNLVRYGYDRLSQICELHAKQYSFNVLTKIYLFRRTYTTVSNMPREANLRSTDRIKFHKLLRQRLGQSGRLPKSAIIDC